MAEGKKSFVLYVDLLQKVEHLTNEELGILFRHMLEYVNDKQPVLEDRLVLTAWKPIEVSLKEDLKRWEEIREKRAEAGAKGGRPSKAKKANGFKEKQSEAKKAVTVTDTVTVTDNVEEGKPSSLQKGSLLHPWQGGSVGGRQGGRQAPSGQEKEKGEEKGKGEQAMHPLVKWLNEDCPDVQKLKEPLTNQQAIKILDRYPEAFARQLFLAMDNYKPLRSKNKSAYQTFLNWANRDANKQQDEAPPKKRRI